MRPLTTKRTRNGFGRAGVVTLALLVVFGLSPGIITPDGMMPRAEAIGGEVFGAVVESQSLWGNGWVTNASVDVSIDNGSGYVLLDTYSTDSNGDWSSPELSPGTFGPGSMIKVEDINTIKTTEVTTIEVTGYDLPSDQSWGTSYADATVIAGIHGKSELPAVVTNDGFGAATWTATSSTVMAIPTPSSEGLDPTPSGVVPGTTCSSARTMPTPSTANSVRTD